MYSNIHIQFTVLFVLVISVEKVLGANFNYENVNKELVITQREKVAFDKFRNAVIGNITEPELVLTRSDLYLLRFIRAKNLDVDVAKKELFAFLTFARQVNFTHLLKEDWSDMEEDFPVTYHFVDKQLRPILYINTAAGWNIRAAVLQGKTMRLRRYFFKMMFEVYNRLLEAGRKNPNVTQELVIFNIESFNLVEHGCINCIYEYLYFFERFQRWVPGYIHEFIMFNSQEGLNLVLHAIRHVISDLPLKILGTNRNVWMNYLEQKVDKHILSKMMQL